MFGGRNKRGPWSQAEDGCLLQLINQTGQLNWVQISKAMGSRTAKQCRERFHQNLKPSLNQAPIGQQEGHQIESLVAQVGPKWAEIARQLGTNRCDNAIKNWWNGVKNRRTRTERREARLQHMRQMQHPHYQQHQQHHEMATADTSSFRTLPPPRRTSIPLPSPFASAPSNGYGMETPLPSPSATSQMSERELPVTPREWDREAAPPRHGLLPLMITGGTTAVLSWAAEISPRSERLPSLGSVVTLASSPLPSPPAPRPLPTTFYGSKMLPQQPWILTAPNSPTGPPDASPASGVEPRKDGYHKVPLSFLLC
ncbi:hypothetical protein BT67DRAFT_447643 [Trichocladium antarcticum]|uniref:Uncharacterized protein n=1 Tax=Trichocladium antarcticum TaxID=1450529 RepID=A0AAN6US68_9PEZI|nr:hypothetical protein BT67DRAFT_447643 [Trichocladium antarcticum]